MITYRLSGLDIFGIKHKWSGVLLRRGIKSIKVDNYLVWRNEGLIMDELLSHRKYNN